MLKLVRFFTLVLFIFVTCVQTYVRTGTNLHIEFFMCKVPVLYAKIVLVKNGLTPPKKLSSGH